MNFSAIMQLKTEWNGFCKRHPKFPLFLNAAQQKGISAGTILELSITAPDGTVLNTNVKVQPEDLEMLKKMREIVS